MTGYIYFLKNPEMANILKIGYTCAGLTERLKQLDTTGVPQEFNVVVATLVNDPIACEKAIHDELADCRVRSKREFFRISPAEAFKRTRDIILVYLPTDGEPVAVANCCNLDQLDQNILQWIFHKEGGEGFPRQACWEFHISEQEAAYRLGELTIKGFLKEDQGGYPLTHKGRKFIFENGLSIDELLDYGGD